jgi:hypothetical protein
MRTHWTHAKATRGPGTGCGADEIPRARSRPTITS